MLTRAIYTEGRHQDFTRIARDKARSEQTLSSSGIIGSDMKRTARMTVAGTLNIVAGFVWLGIVALTLG